MESASFFKLPFEQVGDRQKKIEGTGLGLSISKQIVELMGSQLLVESEFGKGSTFGFAIEVPVSHEWVEVAQTSEQGTIAVVIDEKRLQQVVDDRWENRSVVVSLLEPLGFEVSEAENGRKAWEMMQKNKPDVVITDLMMPQMNGYELLSTMRASETCKDIVAIASSASIFESNQQEAIDSGANVFLPKPVQADQLFRVLQKSLKLEWIYEELNNTNTQETSEAIVPPAQEIEVLLNIAHQADPDEICNGSMSILYR